MRLLYEPSGWSPQLNIGHWFLSVYLDPRRWSLNWHWNAPCCRFWLLVGPFELNRMWGDNDDYPFEC